MVSPLRAFVQLESAASVWLLGATALSLALASSPYGAAVEALWGLPLELRAGGASARFSPRDLLDEGAMTLFFLTAGLELKRAFVAGELANLRAALLPLAGALGGMVAPALLFLACTAGTAWRAGWGIPMATDIAFSLGCVALVGRRVPRGLVLFLMALAIFDDLGAMLVIALFYGRHGSLSGLLGVALAAAPLLLAGRLRARSPWLWALLAGALWLALHRAGLHATMAGVVAGLCVPATPSGSPERTLADLREGLTALASSLRRGDPARTVEALAEHLAALSAPADRWQRALHGVVAWLVVPLFALGNAGLDLRSLGSVSAASSVRWGVLLGLALGKPLGITAAALAASRVLRAPLPAGASVRALVGVSMVAGVGFTMSLFVATLAYPAGSAALGSARLGILLGSLGSALAGLAVLRSLPERSPAQPAAEEEPEELALELPRLAHGWELSLWTARGALVGSSLADFGLRSRFGVTALGRRVRAPGGGEEALSLEPLGPTEPVREGDELLLAATEESLRAFLAHPETQSIP